MTTKKLKGKVAPSKGPKLKGKLTVSEPATRRGASDEEVHELYAKPWSELLSALNDTDVPKREYKESLEHMTGELETRLEAVKQELEAEAEGEG